MLELRTLLAQLVLSFDISPAQEHDAAKCKVASTKAFRYSIDESDLVERSILDYFVGTTSSMHLRHSTEGFPFVIGRKERIFLRQLESSLIVNATSFWDIVQLCVALPRCF